MHCIATRVKSYQSSGFDKIVDPEGGIHLRRIRLEREMRTQPDEPQRIEWPTDGWTLSWEQMPEFQHCYIFAHLAGEITKDSTKFRRGAFKSKREGYALFKAGHVQKVKFNATSHQHVCFFESKVKASMTKNKLYRTRVSLRKETAGVRSGYCNCKAGATGTCKHIGALLFTILDFVESELDQIPPDTTCTERPQQWHKPRSTACADNEAILLSNLLVIKHSYEADKKYDKSIKRAQRKADKQSFEAAPSFSRNVTKTQIERLCKDLETTRGKRPMIIDLLKGNNYQPSITEEMKAKEARTHVRMDHDYCSSGKRKYPVEDEVTADSGFQLPGKKLRDDTYTPLDFNFGRDFCLSHCETIQEEEPPCKTVQQEVTDNFSEFGIENEPKESEQDIPLIETLDIEKHILASKGIQDSCSDDYDLNCEQFKGICSSYMGSLSITDKEISEIEKQTRGQTNNEKWFQYRSGRVTASKFGEIQNRRPSTAPDRLTRDIFQYKTRSAVPAQCAEGLRLEPLISAKYVAKQQAAGHTGLFVEERGLFIDKTTPLLAGSIDGEVSDPTARHGAIGNLEMKYIQFPSKIPKPDGRKELLHIIAENKKNSCLEITNTGLKLKTRHHYYAQIQGGMGISGRQWCDLAVYTYCGNIEDLHVERIYFDPIYWNALKQKLLDFCLFAIVPEILTSRIKNGKHLYPRLFSYK